MVRVPLAITVALACACGPSFQVVYDGDARFEHCYALDESSSVAMQEKTDCWQTWVKHYTYGQTRDRVDYARMRAKALEQAHVLPTDEALVGAAPGGGSDNNSGTSALAPTNAFTAPPRTLSDLDGGVASSGRPARAAVDPSMPNVSPATPAPPGAECQDVCRKSWTSCTSTCRGASCARCEKQYGDCVKSCF